MTKKLDDNCASDFQKMRDKAFEIVYGNSNNVGYTNIYLLLPNFLLASTVYSEDSPLDTYNT